MEYSKKYPMLEINLNKIYENTKYIVGICKEKKYKHSRRSKRNKCK